APCHLRRVVEGADQTGHVDERVALDGSLAERAPWLTLEVDERDVAAAIEDLPEVQVAVNTDAVAVEQALGERAVDAHHSRLRLRQVRRRQFQLRSTAAELAEHFSSLVAHRLEEATLVQAAEPLRPKAGFVARRHRAM